MKHTRGFTLIELLVVVAIFAILVSIAVPAFQTYMFKSRRTDGKTALMGLRIAQEKFRSNCRLYAQTLVNENFDSTNNSVCDPPGGTYALEINRTSPNRYYTLAITAGTANAVGYTATASAVDLNGVATIQSGDTVTDNNNNTVVCSTLTLTVSAANPDGLWTPAACWR